MKNLFFQISDVHIYNHTRFDEYKNVFNAFINEVKNTNPIFVGIIGDVFHSKTTYTPEAFDLLYEFLFEILQYSHIVAIDGNHDINQGNQKRLGSIEPIIKALLNAKTKYTINYLKNSGIYNLELENNKIAFGVFSLRDDKDNWPIVPKKESGRTYIALYHGTIHGAKDDKNFVLENANNTTLFKHYDITLLGDIHKRQYLNDEKTIAYCGSLIQQNFGENNEKGALLWDINKRSAKFVQIQNDYSFLVIDCNSVEEAKEKIAQQHIAPTTNIRIRFSKDIGAGEKEQIKLLLNEQYNLQTEVDIVSDKQTADQYILQHRENLENFNSVTYQIEMLKNWLLANGYGENYIDACVELHKENLKEIKIGDFTSNRWKLLQLKFSNIGPFGENNTIDFTTKRGVVGLFAENKSGKTTIIEVISFALYGKFIKDISLQDILNHTKNSGSVEIDLLLPSKKYRIIRTLKRAKSGKVGSTVNYFCYNKETGEWESEKGDEAKDTKKNLEELFGTQDDLLMTAVASSEDVYGIIKSKQTERLETIYRFTNLDFFEKLNKLADTKNLALIQQRKLLEANGTNEYYQQIETKRDEIKELYINNYQIQQDEFDIEIEKNKLAIEETAAKIVNIDESKIHEYENIKKELSQKENELHNIKADNDKLNKTLEKLEKEIESSQATIQSKQGVLDIKNVRLSSLKKHIQELCKGKKSKEVLELKIPITNINTAIKDSKNELSKLQIKEKQLQRQVEILQQQDWFEQNADCQRCMFLKDAWSAKKDLESLLTNMDAISKEILDNEAKLSDFEFTIEEIAFITDELQQYESVKNDISNCNSVISNAQVVIEKNSELITTTKDSTNKNTEKESLLRSHITLLLNQLNELDSIQLQIKNNQIHIQEKEKYVAANRAIEIKKKDSQVLHFEKLSEVARLEGSLANIQQNITELIAIDSKLRYHDVYVKATDKKGMPLYIINDILPKINAEISSILSTIQNWKIVIKIDNNKLFINLVDIIDGEEYQRPIETGSGFERAVTALSLRIALSQISAMSKPNFMIFDESFASLDSNNKVKIKSFINAIKEFFDFSILISHDPFMQDIIDDTIIISKDETTNISSIL